MTKRFFTSESVAEGHPDKVSDQISDAILDAILKKDKNARVDAETVVMQGNVLVTGQITTKTYVDIPKIVRKVLKDIGFDNARDGLDWRTCGVTTSIEQQSPDIARGVNAKSPEKIGSGDQGLVYGYATDETPELMPMPIMLAHAIVKRLADARKKGILPYLRPDGKSQVTVEYDGGKPTRVDVVVVAAQHTADVSETRVRKDVVEQVVLKAIPRRMIDRSTRIIVNGTGRFVIGGTLADSGLCLTGDTMISTDDGIVPISKLKDRIGAKVYNDEVLPATLVAWKENDIRRTINLTTESGFMIKATPNHPFRTIKNGEYAWKSAADLQTGDYIALVSKPFSRRYVDMSDFAFTPKKRSSRFKDKIPTVLDENLAYLMGYLTGDGTLSNPNYVIFHYGNKGEKEHLLKVTGILGEVQSYSDGKKGGHSGKVQYNSVKFRALLRHLGMDYQYANNHRVPWSIFQSPQSVVAAFVRGYFDADGYAGYGGGRNGKNLSLVAVSTSKMLLHDVKLLLHHMKINCQVYVRKTKKPNSPSQQIDIVGNKSKDRFVSLVGFGLPRKITECTKWSPPNKNDISPTIPGMGGVVASLLARDPDIARRYNFRQMVNKTAMKSGRYDRMKEYNLLEILYRYARFRRSAAYKKLKFFADRNLFFERVAHVRNGRNVTYDITVEPGSTFIANGMVVHNTGRKIIVDTYGGIAPHGGGCFGGKDPTKTDRSGQYVARYIAKNIVAAGLAKRCGVQIAYAIGIPDPVSVHIDTFKTGKAPDDVLLAAVRKVFDLRPGMVINYLKLRRPIYRKTACYGHFGRSDPDFTWERPDRTSALKKAVKELTGAKN